MASSDNSVPTVESEIAGMTKLTPAQRARVVAAAAADATRRAAQRALETRSRVVKRTKLARERLRSPVPMSIGAVLGGAMAEPVRRQLVGRFTKNLWGQAVGLAAIGGALQLAEEGLGIPGVGSLGVGAMGVAGMLGAIKAGYDSKDKRDPVALALEGTTRKAKEERDDQKKKEEADKETDAGT